LLPWLALLFEGDFALALLSRGEVRGFCELGGGEVEAAPTSEMTERRSGDWGIGSAYVLGLKFVLVAGFFVDHGCGDAPVIGFGCGDEFKS
jgi:hypothetical protein